jgi:hypothetical protein
MKKYSISSVNENPEYLFFVPIWCTFWKKIGYQPYVITVNKNISNELMELVSSATEKAEGILKRFEHIDGYKTCNVAQVSRLFAAADPLFKDDDYIITDDIDKFVISKPWFNQQDFSKDIHIFDLDETNYTRLKIGYIGMKAKLWKEVIGISNESFRENLKKCLDKSLLKTSVRDDYRYGSQREKEVDEAWNLDESIITKNVFKSQYYPDKCQLIVRGANQYGLRNGRIDRTAWKQTFMQYISSRIIDVHLHRNPYEDELWKDIKIIMSLVFTTDEIKYFQEYRNKFIKLL